jgi:hypothetical protein
MEQAKAAAAEDNVSINQMLVSVIAEGLGQRRGLRMMRERAARADVGAALAILDKVPDVPLEAGDEIQEMVAICEIALASDSLLSRLT